MKECSLKRDIEAILVRREGERNGWLPGKGTRTLPNLISKRDHSHPSAEDLLIVAAEGGLSFYRTLALILKGEWERDSRPEQNRRAAEGEIYSGDAFNPDTDQIFHLFEEKGPSPTHAGYQPRDFDTLVQQMLLSGLHLVQNDGPEMDRFAEAETQRQEMLRDADPKESEALWIERCRWAEAQEELDDLYVKIENRRLQKAETRRQYLVLLGGPEVDLQEAIFFHEQLKRRRNWKAADPSLTEEAITQLEAEAETLHGKGMEIERLKQDALLAPVYVHVEEASGRPMDSGRRKEYEAQVKSLLRKLRFKIHPDHLRRDPAYERLTDAQKKELADMLQMALQIAPSELGYPPRFVEHDIRSVQGLERALLKVDAILENAGIDIRVEVMIQGNTLAEQIAWLQDATRSLQDRIAAASAELHALATDEDVNRMKNVLANPHQHEAIREAMIREAAEHRAEAEALKKEISDLFMRGDVEETS